MAIERRKRPDLRLDLNLTSMIDMMTILLIFLLMNFSSDFSSVTVAKDLMLPKSTEKRLPESVLNIVFTRNALVVDGKLVVETTNGEFDPSDVTREGYLKPLMRTMNEAKELQDESADDSFKGKVVLQADKSLTYKEIRRVLYTAGEAGFPKFKLLVIKEDQN